MTGRGRYKGYNMNAFRKDLISGTIVGVIAIPLGMAFAIASGVKPEYGIYTTIVAGICISLFGGSKFQIGGPTGAFIPILFAIGMQYGYENLLLAGMMAGVILVLMGLLRLGVLIKFIPKPVTIGFTAGIAVIIFTGQIANFLGLRDIERHESFVDNMKEIGLHLSTINGYSILTAAICLAVVILAIRFAPKVPGSLVGLLCATVIAALFFSGKVTTIGLAYGNIPNTLPSFRFPTITWERITLLIRPAFIIAMLGAIESLLSAVVADGMTGSRHNSNRELIGQGIANIAAPLFGGIPATGAIARTATNIKSGAVSPISGIVHGVVVFLILLLFAPYASSIPLAAMAPILMVVAWNMSERKQFFHLLKIKTGDSLVLFITFLLTIFADLTLAVEVGLILAVILFVKRMGEVHLVSKVLPDPNSVKVGAHMVTESHDCPQIGIYTVEGPLFFGAAYRFDDTMPGYGSDQPKIILMRMGKVPFMDTTGESNLAELVRHLHAVGGKLMISGVQPQPLELLKRTGLYDKIGEAQFYHHTGEAINEALSSINHNKCIGCSHAAFRECTALSCQEDAGGLRGLTGRKKPALPLN
ncbi:sodium-independent anion transporter [Paenibacillus odorifer]|uniref:Sodium-independent anion transporter n=1 Tax=Paenibacillus odorifer TaxID=189426 RepID=A0A1R0WVK6_9BACL|nr:MULTISPECIES: SulP family inorganic anion transporter [Paenibacillus]ETT67698.1 sulfate ABC transporter permease [Paenibacillus sp. FSL H8-237]OMD22370.1 sodium-independent anion transporter [Paenibacillus odorifer]OME51711.1 sodium-independent anion transporter [Paenibacillus odorifer]